MDERTPATLPEGALTPPPRIPPLALATAAPLPPRPPRPAQPPRTAVGVTTDIWSLIDRALGQLDSIGDEIAEFVGLR